MASRYEALAAARLRAARTLPEDPADDARPACLDDGAKRALLRHACEALSGRELDPLASLAGHLLGGKLVMAGRPRASVMGNIDGGAS